MEPELARAEAFASAQGVVGRTACIAASRSTRSYRRWPRTVGWGGEVGAGRWAAEIAWCPHIPWCATMAETDDLQGAA